MPVASASSLRPYFVDTSGNQLLCINVAYSFDVDNLVIHNLLVLNVDKF